MHNIGGAWRCDAPRWRILPAEEWVKLSNQRGRPLSPFGFSRHTSVLGTHERCHLAAVSRTSRNPVSESAPRVSLFLMLYFNARDITKPVLMPGFRYRTRTFPYTIRALQRKPVVDALIADLKWTNLRTSRRSPRCKNASRSSSVLELLSAIVRPDGIQSYWIYVHVQFLCWRWKGMSEEPFQSLCFISF